MLRYRVVGLSFLQTCPLACRDCISESSPRARDRMPFEDAAGYLPHIARVAKSVCFTGGEPFLRWREIGDLCVRARRLGLRVSVVSGAGWVHGEAETRRRVRHLVRRGMVSLLVSWDIYHEEFSSRERAVLLARIAREEGVRVTVRVVQPKGEGMEPYRDAFRGLRVRVERADPPVRVGRATTLPDAHFAWTDAPPTDVCNVVEAPVVETDGSVYACCGPSKYGCRPSPLYLGDARREPLDAILRRSRKDPLLEAIHLIGPAGLLRLLGRVPGIRERVPRRKRYSGICDLCLDLTNDPVVVEELRRRLRTPEAMAYLEAGRMWRLGNRASERKQMFAPAAGPVRPRRDVLLPDPVVSS